MFIHYSCEVKNNLKASWIFFFFFTQFFSYYASTTEESYVIVQFGPKFLETAIIFLLLMPFFFIKKDKFNLYLTPTG